MQLHGSVQVETVERMCRDIMDFSHGKQKVKSSGILEFGVSRDQFEPNVFHTWERYDSNGSLGRHNTCPEFQAFMENVSCLPAHPIFLSHHGKLDHGKQDVSAAGDIRADIRTAPATHWPTCIIGIRMQAGICQICKPKESCLDTDHLACRFRRT